MATSQWGCRVVYRMDHLGLESKAETMSWLSEGPAAGTRDSGADQPANKVVEGRTGKRMRLWLSAVFLLSSQTG